MTGEVIDSAACIGTDGTVYMVSADAKMYALDPLKAENGVCPLIWCLDFARDRASGSKGACRPADPPFTLSTIAWFEANIVLGPQGFLYAGCDDFYFYSVLEGGKKRQGKIRWAFPSGLNIWTAAGFDGKRLFFLSFDMHLYALEAAGGKLLWKLNTKNLCASSPAIDQQGRIYFGSYDRKVYAIDPGKGKTRWTFKTGGPIYASPALSPQGDVLYVTSSDAVFYALRTDNGSLLWKFFLGQPSLSSPSLGPDLDPQGTPDDYLIYVGSGTGLVYALDPKAQGRRWSYNALVLGGSTEFPAVNSSLAIGASGAATALANGDAVYIPFRYYLRKNAQGIDRQPGDGYRQFLENPRWYYISPGGSFLDPDGKPWTEPIPESDPPDPPPQLVWTGYALSTVSFRALAPEGKKSTGFDTINPSSVKVSISPSLRHRLSISADRTQVNILPLEVPQGDVAGEVRQYTIRAETEACEPISGRFGLKLELPRNPPPIESLPRCPFAVEQMSIYSPFIIPAFDMIGIASLTIDLRAIRVDEKTGRVVAWGLEQFRGSGASRPRSLLYAFGGVYRAGNLLLEAENCRFELTALPVPLDRLRFAAAWDEDGFPELGASMSAEYRATFFKILAAAFTASRGGLGSLGGLFPRRFGQLRNWALILWRILPLVWRALSGRLVSPWDLLDAEGRFIGVGTFKAKEAKSRLTAGKAKLDRIVYKKGLLGFGRRVVAEVSLGEHRQHGAFAICLIDLDAGQPLFLDYTVLTQTKLDEVQQSVRVTLSIPFTQALAGKRIRAVALEDLRILGSEIFH